MPADVVAALTPATRRDELALHLISGPYVVERGCRRELPENSRRVLALVALRPDWLSRATAAGRLWPGGDEHRAAGNLRSALWRMRGASLDLIEGDLVDRARQLIRGRPRPADLQPSTWRNVPELLPGRTDEWLEPHRDHLRLLVRSALRALSRHLTGSGRYAEAVEAALAAVALDPFDENARIALVAAHLAEGNLIEARRAVAYRGMALRELGVEPNHEFTALLHGTAARPELRSPAVVSDPAVRRCPRSNGARLPHPRATATRRPSRNLSVEALSGSRLRRDALLIDALGGPDPVWCRFGPPYMGRWPGRAGSRSKMVVITSRA